MKYLKLFEDVDHMRDYLSDLFVEWSDKWSMHEVTNIAQFLDQNCDNDPDNLEKTIWAIYKSNKIGYKYMIAIFFSYNYGNCGIKGSGKYNQDSDYLSPLFREDMEKYVERLKKIGYHSYTDFRGGGSTFAIHIR